MDLKTTILLFALICALAAVFVLWSKWEEEKVKTREERENYQAALRIGNANAEALREEHNRRWDEISRAVGLENELEQSKAREKCTVDAVMWYAEMLMDTKRERDDLQDRLSALLCPTANHVWKDGVCVKCGRAKDAAN